MTRNKISLGYDVSERCLWLSDERGANVKRRAYKNEMITKSGETKQKRKMCSKMLPCIQKQANKIL